jgi:hypothetical protein
MNKIKRFFVCFWIILKNKENDNVLKAFYTIAKFVTEKTKTDVDNAALASIAAFVRDQTKTLSSTEAMSVAKMVTKYDKGGLKNVDLGIDSNSGISLNYKNMNVSYNYNDGSVRWSKRIDI